MYVVEPLVKTVVVTVVSQPAMVELQPLPTATMTVMGQQLLIRVETARAGKLESRLIMPKMFVVSVLVHCIWFPVAGLVSISS